MQKQTAPRSSKPYLVHFLVLTMSLGAALKLLPDRESEPTVQTEAPEPVQRAASVPHEQVPDFSSIDDTNVRKAVFFGFLRPYVDQVNAEMLALRAQVSALAEVEAEGTLSKTDKALLDRLSMRFEVQPRLAYSQDHFQQLLTRIDVLPVSLVLAQAANETAWGTSRFALQGNNFFGQWCYTKGCGLVPDRRSNGASHEVKSFDSVADSVRSYFMNLNTYPSYRKLRIIRQELRDAGQSIDGISLSEGLHSYSARGQAYIDELRSMIYYNELHQLDARPQA